MGNTNTIKNNEETNYESYLRPGLKLSDIKNISKAFKLLDKDEDGVIYYNIEKMSDSKY